MDSHNTLEDLEEIEAIDALPNIRNMPQREQRPVHLRGPKLKSRRKHSKVQLVVEMTEQSDAQEAFNFSYHASRHERVWIIDSLGPFYEGQWLDDVLRLLKGGKEAHVYQCQSNPSVAADHAHDLDNEYIAAKVYRPRMFRNLRKDHIYREGRSLLDSDGQQVIDDRMLRAVDQRTEYGRRLMHESWIEHEFQALKTLHAVGADVPVPLERGNNAILMSYVGADDLPAPTLNEVNLAPDEALQLYQRVLHNIDLMLAQDLVHGDLSAYNILYWQGKITLIDFPQVINPHVNHSAYNIFARDVQRVCEYFTRQGLRCNPRRIAEDLWTAHGHRLSPEANPALLDADDEGDCAYWRRISGT